ncbi:MAG: hydroxyphenylacetyl-CoA thioesterase PaaI [Thermodesulfobacteria bacterium]|nr:hydroxyphenylacetyl-CoA thioesterase PaaI [Thermodesulfobacteriota bacterium]
MLPEDPQERARTIAAFMSRHDQLAVSFGMEILEVRPGFARVKMKVTSSMLNAVKLCHGGAIFSLADFAFAVASNSYGQVAVALSAHINYPAPAKEGDELLATAREISRTRRTGLYQVEVRRQDETLVALFTGNVFLRQDTLADWMFKNTSDDK